MTSDPSPTITQGDQTVEFQYDTAGRRWSRELGMMRPGGENVEQFAEYHRSKRLAEAVLDAIEPDRPHRTSAPADLGRTTAATLFPAWLRENRPDQRGPDDLDELVTELADSWHISGPAAHTAPARRTASRSQWNTSAATTRTTSPSTSSPCSRPWTAWLADRNAAPAHLADRCRPYAHSESHKAVKADDGRPDYLARTAE